MKRIGLVLCLVGLVAMTSLFCHAHAAHSDNAPLFAADVKKLPGEEKRSFSGMVIPKQSDVPQFTPQAGQPSGFSKFWKSVSDTAIAQRVGTVCSWMGDGLKLLWAVPKAVVKGDSSSLIEAIGDLLSRTSEKEQAQQESHDPESESMSDEVDDNPVQSRQIRRDQKSLRPLVT